MSQTLVEVLLSDNWRLSIVGSAGAGGGICTKGMGILTLSPTAGYLFLFIPRQGDHGTEHPN